MTVGRYPLAAYQVALREYQSRLASMKSLGTPSRAVSGIDDAPHDQDQRWYRCRDEAVSCARSKWDGLWQRHCDGESAGRNTIIRYGEREGLPQAIDSDVVNETVDRDIVRGCIAETMRDE
ncbi:MULTISPECIES: hypothetical protein [Chelativorans]|uniref:Uncharacterized protein n=1 Tax=Chelativorans sp. (strain BNC1) TaxID=266779 RepID=Q11IX8_CHESB|nr:MULTISPECIES: hypothetical protein [Chelativorans]